MDPRGLDALGSMKIERVPEQTAGYMELAGAVKDGDCARVEVDGGVSSQLGCCNLFEPDNPKAKKFSCGTCEYMR
jgi:hypothetical protein